MSSDLKSVAAAAGELRRAGEPFLVATVASVRGSAYRRPGARMLLTRDRWVAGSVSGGCLERDLVKKAWWLARRGEPVLATYDARGDDDVGWGFGLGCDGAVDVLVERDAPGPADPLSFFVSCREAQYRATVATVVRSEHPGAAPGARLAIRSSAAEVVTSGALDVAAASGLAARCEEVLVTGDTETMSFTVGGARVDALVEAIVPPLRLFVLGTGHDAVPVVALASALGWDVVVCEPRAYASTRARFTQADAVLALGPEEAAAEVARAACAACVVMSHEYSVDRAYLGALLATSTRYLGVLGPRRRTERMLGELGVTGDARLHAPVGLELGAESPAEIALAIVAEVKAAISGASALPLRERRGPIHATTDRPACAVE